MPLVRIALAAGKSPTYRQAIADGVHQALVSVLKVPADDRFQIITEQAGNSLIYDKQYLGIHRSDDIVVIQVFLRRGRSPEMKQEFYRQVAAHLTRDPGLDANDIFITLSENDLADWSFGQGRAQYVENPPVPLTASEATATQDSQKAEATKAGTVLASAGAVATGGFVILGLLAALHGLMPVGLEAALSQTLSGITTAALATFTA